MGKSKKKYDVALIGGDARVAFMAPFLLEKGMRVVSCQTDDVIENDNKGWNQSISIKEAIEESQCIVGGIPLFKNGNVNGVAMNSAMSQESFYKSLEQNQMVFGGMIPTQFEMLCREKDIECYDFLKEETITIFNAIATAEGAILEALKNKSTNIHGSSTLVMGFGRCGKILADKLKGMGANVSICARNPEACAYAKAYGYHSFSFEKLEEQIGEFEYVYNTVPSLVLTKALLEKMRRDVLIIDIASKNGGVDYACAKQLKLHAMQCLGLPGKYAPKISAKILAEYVVKKISFAKN